MERFHYLKFTIAVNNQFCKADILHYHVVEKTRAQLYSCTRRSVILQDFVTNSRLSFLIINSLIRCYHQVCRVLICPDSFDICRILIESDAIDHYISDKSSQSSQVFTVGAVNRRHHICTAIARIKDIYIISLK
jgi:hypothetical protein